MKNWTFGKRMAAGFGAIILIIILLGSLATVIMNRGSATATILSRDYTKALNLVADYNHEIDSIRIHITPYVLTGSAERLREVKATLAELDQTIRDLEQHLKNSSNLADAKAIYQNCTVKLQAYRRNIESTIEAREAFTKAHAISAALGPAWTESMETLVQSQYRALQEEVKTKVSPNAIHAFYLASDIRASCTDVRLINSKAVAYRDPKIYSIAEADFKKLDDAMAELEPLLQRPDEIQALADVRKYADEYRQNIHLLSASFAIIEEDMRQRDVLGTELNAAVSEIFHHVLQLTDASTAAAATQLDFGKLFVSIGALIGLALASFLAFTITRSTSGLLKRIISQLSTGTVQTAAAAEQLSNGSQTLALGANEQAASLEETSASMEEMTSMTKRNAENAANAKDLAKNAREAAEKAVADVQGMTEGMKTVAQSSAQLNRAMDSIQSSSSAITQIMKTIDEIAFQTNILSINAAVEAARAGEAGSGFAVVADEVRTLAQRSADAAKETAKMIQESSENSRQGILVTQKVAADLEGMNHMAAQVNNSLESIVGQVRKVDEVIAEIATACHEQNQGISQVNIALSQMDKITQSNAASAEESASAAEEVSSHAAEAQSVVGDLAALVGTLENELESRPVSYERMPTARKSTLSAPNRIRNPLLKKNLP